MFKGYRYDDKLYPARIAVTVDGEKKSVVAYVTRRELDLLITYPYIDVEEIED